MNQSEQFPPPGFGCPSATAPTYWGPPPPLPPCPSWYQPGLESQANWYGYPVPYQWNPWPAQYNNTFNGYEQQLTQGHDYFSQNQDVPQFPTCHSWPNQNGFKKKMHRPGAKRIKLDTPEEILKWREERKKKMKKTRKWKTSSDWHGNHKGFGRFRKWEMSKNQLSNCNDSQTTASQEDMAQANTAKDTDPLGMFASSEPESDKDEDHKDKKEGLTVVPKLMTSGLGALVANYASSSESESDEVPEELPLRNVSKVLEENQTILRNAPLRSKNVLPHEHQDVNIQRKYQESGAVFKKGHRFCPRKKGRKAQQHPIKRHPTLLEMLLARDIRHERNVILQCVRYIVRSNLFGLDEMATPSVEHFSNHIVKAGDEATSIGDLKCTVINENKLMASGKEDCAFSDLLGTAISSVSVYGESINLVEKFTYLGSDIHVSGGSSYEVSRWIVRAWGVMSSLERGVWRCQYLCKRMKVQVFRVLVLPVLLYGCETWTLSSDLRRRLDSFGTVSLWKILGYCWFDFVSNERLLMESRMRHITCIVRERHLRHYGHVACFTEGDATCKILFVGDPSGWTRPRSRPCNTWLWQIEGNFQKVGLDRVSAWGIANWDPELFRHVVRAAMLCTSVCSLT
ncbi:NUFP1 protein, partial [Polypterus senegalus]